MWTTYITGGKKCREVKEKWIHAKYVEKRFANKALLPLASTGRKPSKTDRTTVGPSSQFGTTHWLLLSQVLPPMRLKELIRGSFVQLAGPDKQKYAEATPDHQIYCISTPNLPDKGNKIPNIIILKLIRFP